MTAEGIEMQIPEDLKEEYKRLAAVRREIGDYSSATRSTIEDMSLIERIARLEAQNAKLHEAIESWKKEELVWRQINHEAAIKAQQMQAGAEEILAQNAKLREALEKIEDKADGYADDSEDGLRGLRFRELSKQARAALQQERQ